MTIHGYVNAFSGHVVEFNYEVQCRQIPRTTLSIDKQTLAVTVEYRKKTGMVLSHAMTMQQFLNTGSHVLADIAEQLWSDSGDRDDR